MNYMRNAGVPIDKRYQVLKSFDVNSIKVITATENTYGLRFYDNVYAYSKGRYLFPSFNNYTNRVGLALPYEWNQMTKLKQWQIEPGNNNNNRKGSTKITIWKSIYRRCRTMVYNGFKFFEIRNKVYKNIELIKHKSLKSKFKELINVVGKPEIRRRKKSEILRFIIDNMDYKDFDVEMSNKILKDITTLIQISDRK